MARLPTFVICAALVAASCSRTETTAGAKTTATSTTPTAVDAISTTSVDSEPVAGDGWSIWPIDYAVREASTYSSGSDWFFTWGGAPDRSSALPTDGLLFHLSESQFQPVPDAPLDARRSPSSVWTGSEFIVFGGHSATTSFVDGAAFDPDLQSWRPIAAAPLRTAARPAAVWFESRMYVWLPSYDSSFAELPQPGPGQFARYNPSSDSWEQLPTPAVNVVDAILLADDDRLILVGGPPMRDLGTLGPSPALQVSTFDPSTATWTDSFNGPETDESPRPVQIEGQEIAVVSASGLVQPLAESIEPIAQLGSGCWYDTAATAGGGATYIKWCGNVTELRGLTASQILAAGEPGTTSNTYGSGFVADETGRLLVFGDLNPDADLPTGRAFLGIYDPVAR